MEVGDARRAVLNVLTQPSDPSENLHDFCIIVSDARKRQKEKKSSESSTLQYQAIISQYTQALSNN